MSNPFVAEIRIFPFNFAPRGWAFFDGQLLPLSQNTALFSLLGTTYGGDGRSNFALPNLQGSVPLQQGQGPGLSFRDLGETGGEDNVTLLTTENTGQASASSPANTNIYSAGHFDDGAGHKGAVQIYTAQTPVDLLNFNSVGVAGSSFPHNNLMPYLTLNFCIALQGVFPPRT